MKNYQQYIVRMRNTPAVALGAALIVLAVASAFIWLPAKASSGTTILISQVPLTVATPGNPQVLIAFGNSESMDGTLNGAIMAGSGSVPSGLSSLNNSSSPLDYVVPSGFTPPLVLVDPNNSSGLPPYTVTQSGNLVDNGASRLNVAKAGIQAIINAYMQNTDFALETYSTSNTSNYTTYVYYMSPPSSGFVFTNTQITGNRYVTNPCYGYKTASSTVKSNCASIAAANLWSGLATSLYMQIGASSDDSNINDILYDSGQPGVSIVYGGPNHLTPYPPYFSLANYNSASITMSYPSSVPGTNATATGPTNAGYVPYSNQVMYVQRGFGYLGSQSASTGNVVVPLQSVGLNPTEASVAAAIAKFTPYLAPETNSSSTGEIKASAGQAPTAGLLAGALTSLSKTTTSSTGCAQKQYVVLISDGLPTQDLSGKNWPPLGSAAATGYGVTATFNSDGSLASTNDQALTDTINNLKKLANAGINTYVIGLGAGVDPTANPQAAATLTAMAIAGGTQAYFAATSPAVLVTDLNTILLEIQAASVSTTSASVNASKLQTGTDEYQTSFNSSDTPYSDWTGDLFVMALDPVTGIPTGSKIWSAQSVLDTQVATNGSTPSGRLIATWNPSSNSGVPFEWLTTGGISTAQKALLQPSDSLGQLRLNYLRGDSSLEVRNYSSTNTGAVFRNRSHLLGDITDSQPAYVGVPAQPYTSASYLKFVNTQANRQAMIYVGGNDGMLHAFNATTGTGGGAEVFAFIPNGVFANLQALTHTIYNQSHLFYVDATPQVSDVQFSDNTWHTILVGGEGAGGKSMFALDVTNPTSFTTEASVAAAALWEFTDTDLGLTYSIPQIAPVAATPGFAVFFGNGYNSPNNNAVLYAVNPQTGATIAKINLCTATGVPSSACNSSLPQGLSSVAVANSDGLQGLPIAQVYAGDLQGNLWAIDVGNADPSSWNVRLIFQARDPSGNIQPITTAPIVTLQPNYPTLLGNFVMFGTGQLLATTDMSNTQTETVYGIWDKPGNTTLPTRSTLQAQTLTSHTAASESLAESIITASSTAVNWATKYGWYTDLSLSNGQRVVTTPQLLNGALLLTVNTPPANTCNVGYTSAFLELNFQTGGTFSQAQITLNGIGLPTNTVGYLLGTGYATAPTVIGVNKNNQISVLITQAGGGAGCGGTCDSPLLKNNTQNRIGWWQIQ